MSKNQASNYQKYRDYFLAYQATNRPPRKYPYCVVCGQPNETKKLKRRLIKTCSVACSYAWKRIYAQNQQINQRE